MVPLSWENLLTEGSIAFQRDTVGFSAFNMVLKLIFLNCKMIVDCEISFLSCESLITQYLEILTHSRSKNPKILFLDGATPEHSSPKIASFYKSIPKVKSYINLQMSYPPNWLISTGISASYRFEHGLEYWLDIFGLYFLHMFGWYQSCYLDKCFPSIMHDYILPDSCHSWRKLNRRRVWNCL